ncbi:Pentatricopeptide repeat-containing protein [Sesamum angolense]|uniref:Pentatricopeptide repeat-containing protein n=1 Tax=Sesamum angolense TaxID=2727404 RepID=A0AAE1VZ60_9LAMI|nr:Pentatricopeptide repeat-containing protein [Sesamum angolense]
MDMGLKLLTFSKRCNWRARPDYVTFVNILSACSHMGLVDKGWEYFHSMPKKFGIVPRVEHYACMVDILGRAGKLHEAKEFIESATIDHGLCLWRILLSACRNHRNYELGAYAGEKLMELGSQESSAYVLLSSIYSALGRLNDVERVRRIMSIRGLAKSLDVAGLSSRIRSVVSDNSKIKLAGICIRLLDPKIALTTRFLELQEDEAD